MRRCIYACVVLAMIAAPVRAQDPARTRLIDQVPFDFLTLDKANDSRTFKVYPVNLPGRKVPVRPRSSERLKVRLMENDQEYEVAWTNVAKLDFFEQMVLAEAA